MLEDNGVDQMAFVLFWLVNYVSFPIQQAYTFL